MSYRIDLNCDLGESFGHYVLGQDELILDLVTSANIACGYHAGDHNVMSKTVSLAVEKQVAIGAHPGFPDLMGFGRREMQLSPDEVFHLVLYQVGALQAFTRYYGTQLQHVKPHGALYNMASIRPQYAEAIAKAVRAIDPELILLGLAGSELVKAGQKQGLKVAQEVFADRTYQSNGTLTPRTQSNSMIHDPEEGTRRVLQMIQQGVTIATDGTEIEIQADTVCIHGDQPTAVAFAKRLRQKLQEQEVQILSIGATRL